MIEVQIDLVDLHYRSDGRVGIAGKTNLPRSTELLVNFAASPSGFRGQAKTAVTLDGDFRAGPFGPRGGLRTGEFTVEVLMPVSHVQPEDVRGVIGPEGQNLSGPLVEYGRLGRVVRTAWSIEMSSGGELALGPRLPSTAETADSGPPAFDPTLSSGELVGQWKNRTTGSRPVTGVPIRYEIHRLHDALYMVSVFGDGSSGVERLIHRQDREGRTTYREASRLNNDFDDHYMISDAGELEIRDREGLVKRLPPMIESSLTFK